MPAERSRHMLQAFRHAAEKGPNGWSPAAKRLREANAARVLEAVESLPRPIQSSVANVGACRGG